MRRRSRRQLLAGFGALAGAMAVGVAVSRGPFMSKQPGAANGTPTVTPLPFKAVAPAALNRPTTPTPASVPTTAATATPIPPTATALPTSYGPTTIAVWHSHPEWKNGGADLGKAFSQIYPGIAVKISARPGGTAKLREALSAKDAADVLELPPRPVLDTIARAGQVLDLTAAVDRAAWSAATTSEVTVGNRLWAVPLTKYLVGIAYDVATFQRAKLAGPPKTWSDLGTAFAALKKLDAIPEATAVKDGSLIYYSFMGLASTVLGPAGFAALLAGNRRLDDADLVAVLDQLVAWSDSYQKKPEASTYLEARTLFTTGQAASIVASTIDLAGYASVAPGRKLGFFPWPASDAAHDPLANRGLASLFAVNAATADPAAALGFARWLGSPPAAQIALDPLNLLPALDGVTPRGSGNALTTSLLAVPADVPVWHEQPLLAGLPQVWGQSGPNLITKKLSSADFAKSLQADVDKRRSGSG